MRSDKTEDSDAGASTHQAQALFSLYLVRTKDGALYTGISTDPERRLEQHASGRGAKSLRARAPLNLVYSASIGDRSLALRAEIAVKKLCKARKEKIVDAQPSTEHLLRLLSLESRLSQSLVGES